MSCVRGCCPDYKTHIKGVKIGGFPTQTTYREKKLTKDRDAYKAMRKDGVQPKSVMGAYAVQQNAKDVREVEMGRPIDRETKAALDDAGI